MHFIRLTKTKGTSQILTATKRLRLKRMDNDLLLPRDQLMIKLAGGIIVFFDFRRKAEQSCAQYLFCSGTWRRTLWLGSLPGWSFVKYALYALRASFRFIL